MVDGVRTLSSTVQDINLLSVDDLRWCQHLVLREAHVSAESEMTEGFHHQPDGWGEYLRLGTAYYIRREEMGTVTLTLHRYQEYLISALTQSFNTTSKDQKLHTCYNGTLL